MPGRIPLRIEVHLTAAETDHAFCLIVDHPRPGWGLPPHRHLNESETVYVVDGRFEMDVEGTLHELGPGDSCFVPRGALHSGRTPGDRPAKRVVVFAPGGIEDFFLSAGTTAPVTAPDLSELADLAHRFGWRFGTALD